MAVHFNLQSTNHDRSRFKIQGPSSRRHFGVPGTLLWPSPATSALASSARAGSHDFVRGTLPTGMLSSGQRFPPRDMVRRMRKANVEAGRIWT